MAMRKSAVNGTSSSHLRAFFRLYTFAFFFFRVTGQNPQTTRRLALYAFFSFFDSLP